MLFVNVAFNGSDGTIYVFLLVLASVTSHVITFLSLVGNISNQLVMQFMSTVVNE